MPKITLESTQGVGTATHDIVKRAAQKMQTRNSRPSKIDLYGNGGPEVEATPTPRMPRIEAPVFDDGGDVAVNQQQSADAALRAGASRDIAPPPALPAIPQYTHGGDAGRSRPAAGVKQPSYMPGGGPEAPAPAMPVISLDTSKAPVFDEGGDVDVNDGKHATAIVEDGERVLTPEENAQYTQEHPEEAAAHARPTQVAQIGQAPHPANEPLIPERGTPEERTAIQTDKQNAMGKGIMGLKDLGLAAIHQRNLEPSISDSTETQITPRKIVVPQESHQETAGGPLIAGAPNDYSQSQRRDFAGMERKARLTDYDQRIQVARDSGDETAADKLALAKSEYEKATPWGTEGNHPGILGKIGHIAADVGNIAGNIVAPSTMALIPGTALNRQLKERQTFGRIATDTENDAREAQANAKDTPTPSWKEVTGGLLNPKTGQYEQAFYNEKNPSQQVFAGQLPPKAGGDKAETREQHLNRYAELKNQVDSGAQLGEQDQKEFNTLKTELTVPKATLDSYNKQIDGALHAAQVDPTLWSNYHVLPGATAEEAKQAIADAKAFSGETYQQGAEGRTMDKEERAQQRKDKSTVVYAEDENGQLIKTTKFEADKRSLVSEEMKAGDITKDRSAIRQLNDVQTNVNRYEKAIEEDLPKVSDDDRKRMTEIMALEKDSGGGLISADAGGKGVFINGTFPKWSAELSSTKFDKAKEDLEALSPEAKSVMNAYLRTAASVPTYLKALAGIGRSNKETLELELANVPLPWYDTETARGRMQSFQGNVDQAKSGFPNNLPGMKLVESERSKGAKVSHPTEEAVIPKGATGIAPGSDGNKYYHDAQGNILGKVK